MNKMSWKVDSPLYRMNDFVFRMSLFERLVTACRGDTWYIDIDYRSDFSWFGILIDKIVIDSVVLDWMENLGNLNEMAV